MESNSKESYPYNFIIHYALIYSLVACYSTFVPLYFSYQGFSKSAIGVLLAVGPAIAMVMQPVWGTAGDRAKSKNSILKIMLVGSGIAVLLYVIPANFYIMMAFVAVFTFFQGSINAMSDVISLEYLESTKWEYGPVRLAGSLGYAVTAVIAGAIARWNIANVFFMYSAITFITLLRVNKLPMIKGHREAKSSVNIWELKKNGKLVLLLCFNLLIFTTLGYNTNFFSIFYKQMGADTSLIGICMFIQAVSEVPFLLFANKVLKKLGIEGTLLLATFLMGIRWLMLHFVQNIYIVPVICILNGVSYVVVTYCLVTYINQAVPKELRASGQILNGLVTFIGTSIVGSLLGGILSDLFGIRQIYFYTFIINMIAVVAFGALFLWKNSENRQ